MDDTVTTVLPTEQMPTQSELDKELIPITEAVDIVEPAKLYKEFEQVPIQVLETITLPEVAVILNLMIVSINRLSVARNLAKYPNIVMPGFNPNDYAPAEEPFL